MKKIILIFMFISAFSFPVSAQSSTESYEKEIENITSQYGIDFEEIKEYPFETLWQTVKETVKKTVSQPFANISVLAAILLVTSVVNFMATENIGGVTKVVNTISVVLLFYNIYGSFSSLALNIGDGLNDIKNFMTTFLPVFAGISFAAGEFTASVVYAGFFLVCVVLVANFCTNYILPSLNLFLAIGITSCVSSVINLRPLCEFYSKTVKLAMTAAVSVLCFVLSLQTTIASGRDSLVLKAGRLFVTSTVPVIGQALEGAVGSVYASMGVLKGFCGLAGIAVILNIFLPSLLKLSANWAMFYLLAVVSDILENKSAGGMLLCFKDVTEIMLSMTVLFVVLLMFSLTVMIKTAGGV